MNGLQPIRVDGHRLVIESELMEAWKVYSFVYLGTKMVAIKDGTGAINLYQEIDKGE